MTEDVCALPHLHQALAGSIPSRQVNRIRIAMRIALRIALRTDSTGIDCYPVKQDGRADFTDFTDFPAFR